MRQHSYLSGLSSVCLLPLLVQLATGMWRMNGALRRLLFIQIKKQYGCLFFALVGIGFFWARKRK